MLCTNRSEDYLQKIDSLICSLINSLATEILHNIRRDSRCRLLHSYIRHATDSHFTPKRSSCASLVLINRDNEDILCLDWL